MKNIFKNYNQYKTTGIGIILLILSIYCLLHQIITGTEFTLILPTILILFGINDKAFKKIDQ